MHRRAISPVISTVLITATLLIILVVASSLATTLLEIQIQNSEFEQAKTAMRLLNNVIADVSLKPGAVSSVQFNQRSGGIGLYGGETLSISIIQDSSVIWSNTTSSHVIKYRGGSMVSAAEVNLTGPVGLIVEGAKALGRVHIEVGDGAWIILDYNRVRVVDNRDPSIKTVDIYLISLKPGTFGGSGTVTVKVQNRGVRLLYHSKLTSSSMLRVRVGENIAERLIPEGFTVKVMETIIEVSIM